MKEFSASGKGCHRHYIAIFVSIPHSIKVANISAYSASDIFRLVYTGARMPIYEIIRNRVFEMPPASEKARRDKLVIEHVGSEGQLTKGYVFRAAAGGVISGALAQFICSPTDLLKVSFVSKPVFLYFLYNCFAS